MKFLYNLLIILFIFYLTACISGGGGKGNSENTTTPTSSESTPNSDSDPSENSDSSVDNGNFTVMAYSSILGYLTDAEGNSVTYDQIFNEFGRAFEEGANNWLNLPKGDIAITFQDCDGIVNAFYDPENVEITMCYDLLIELINFYGQSDKGIATFLFAFYHELGHALIDQLNLPVIGNQESAVDGFAAIIAVETDIPESAIFAGFFFLSRESLWADEHDMGANRLGNLACWVMGGAPHLLLDSSIMNLAAQLYEAERDCPAEYEEQKNAVNTLLSPFEKTEQLNSLRKFY